MGGWQPGAGGAGGVEGGEEEGRDFNILFCYK